MKNKLLETLPRNNTQRQSRTKIVTTSYYQTITLSRKQSYKEFYRMKTKCKLIPLPQTTVILALLVINFSSSTYQQQSAMCPKVCICDEQNLEVQCNEALGTSGLPHTLNPSTRKMFINHGQASIFGGLDDLGKLEILDLAYNKLSSLDSVALTNNVRLISLNTSHNSISELKDSHKDVRLLDVELENTDLEILKRVRNSKINVVEFVLNHNHLTIIRNYTFIRWYKLKRLDLSYNMISTLEINSMSGLSKLESLNLRGNLLKQIPSNALGSTRKSLMPYAMTNTDKISPIKFLDISENPLFTLELNSFLQMEQMQELYLESCSLVSIHEQAFRGLHRLSILSLDDNQLQEVPAKSFSYLGFLKLLKLNLNNLSKLQLEDFTNLAHLEELQLNNATFSQVPKGVFGSLFHLRRLEIANNSNLHLIEKGALHQLPNLNYLSLYSNSLTSISETSIAESGTLTLVDLRGNPLHCGCELKWLTRWLKKFNETIKDVEKKESDKGQLNRKTLPVDIDHAMEIINQTCSSPPALKNKLVIELPENKLECIEPSSELNLHVGFASLFFIASMMVLACLFNFMGSKKHLFVMLKENIAHGHLAVHNHDTSEMKKETQLYGADYEAVEDFGTRTQVFTIPSDQLMYYEPQQFHEI